MGNRTRKLLTVGVIAAMTLSMAACTSGNDTSSSSGSSDKKETKAGTGKIGVAMPTKRLTEMESGRREHEETAGGCRIRS